MTVNSADKHFNLSPYSFIGLSTDIKPVTVDSVDMPVLSTFYEKDTDNTYLYDGESWEAEGVFSGDGVRHVAQLLSSNGDGTGIVDFIGEYIEDTDFYITAPAGKVLYIARININVQDDKALSSDKYGNAVILTNGVKLIEKHGDEENQLGIPIIVNSDYSLLAGVDVVPLVFGTGDEYLAVRLTFTKFGNFIKLTENDKLIIRLNDNFTGLTGHKFMINGMEITL